MAAREAAREATVIDVAYRELVNDPLRIIAPICERAGLPRFEGSAARMAESTKTERTHRYSLEEILAATTRDRAQLRGLPRAVRSSTAGCTTAASPARSRAYLHAELCFPPTYSVHSSSVSRRPAAVQASSTSRLASNGHSRAVPS